MIEKFKDDDAGYLAWIARHPSDYVVNAERRPRATYLFLHRAMCPRITKLQAGARRWTGDYIKLCSLGVKGLPEWAGTVGERGHPCAHRKP